MLPPGGGCRLLGRAGRTSYRCRAKPRPPSLTAEAAEPVMRDEPVCAIEDSRRPASPSMPNQLAQAEFAAERYAQAAARLRALAGKPAPAAEQALHHWERRNSRRATSGAVKAYQLLEPAGSSPGAPGAGVAHLDLEAPGGGARCATAAQSPRADLCRRSSPSRGRDDGGPVAEAEDAAARRWHQSGAGRSGIGALRARLASHSQKDYRTAAQRCRGRWRRRWALPNRRWCPTSLPGPR